MVEFIADILLVVNHTGFWGARRCSDAVRSEWEVGLQLDPERPVQWFAAPTRIEAFQQGALAICAAMGQKETPDA